MECVATDELARTSLHERAKFFRKELMGHGVMLDGDHYIGNIVFGADADAVKAANYLQQAGFDVRAIRPPTVPTGTARLRISIHADHQESTLTQLAMALANGPCNTLPPLTREAR
jgi:8-amino-7-oxononanoate synthase